MTTNLMLLMGYSASATSFSKELKLAEHSFLTRSDFLTSIPTTPPPEFSLGVINISFRAYLANKKVVTLP